MAEALIVADTGPLIALSHVDALHVLPSLYGEVLIPEAVADELRGSRFESVHDLIERHSWLQVRVLATPPDPALRAALDEGEAAAITLAITMKAPLLIDERRGRRIASSIYGVDVRGTLGTLVRARKAELVGPLAPLLEKLVVRGDHLGQELIIETLRAVDEHD